MLGNCTMLPNSDFPRHQVHFPLPGRKLHGDVLFEVDLLSWYLKDFIPRKNICTYGSHLRPSKTEF